MGLRTRFALASALVVLASASSLAQDDDDKTRLLPGKLSAYVQDADGVHVTKISLRDGSEWIVDDQLPDRDRRAIDVTILTLPGPNEDIVVKLNAKNLVIAVTKGKVVNDLHILPPNVQQAVKAAKQDDEIKITQKNGKAIYGKFDGLKSEGIVFHPLKSDKGNVRIYDVTGYSSVKYSDVDKFENLNRAGDKPSEVAKQKDRIDEQDLRVGDTVSIGFVKGRIVELTPQAVKIKEWKSGGWGGERSFARDGSLPAIAPASLVLRRSQTVNGTGEIVVDEEVSLLGKSSHLTIKGTLWHDQREHILSNAVLVFSYGPKDADLNQGATKEEWPVPGPLFYDERAVESRNPTEAEEGQVVLGSGFNLVPVRSPKAKPLIVQALATKTDTTTLGRVYDAAALNADPDLAIVLATRMFQIDSRITDAEKQKGMILDALRSFENQASARAVLDHVLTPDGGYSIPECDAEKGEVKWKDQKDRATSWKKLEIELLAQLPGAAVGDRGKRLFMLFQERNAELGEPILKIFVARTGEAIDALLDFAVSLSTHPTQEELKRAEDAANVIRNLGDKALDELIPRVKVQGQAGLALAKQLEALRKSKPVADLIDTAINELVRWKSEERRRELDRTLEEAKARAAERKWDEALVVTEKVLLADASHEEARKLAADYTYRVAEMRRDQKKRGEAAGLFRKVLEAKTPPAGAAPALARILLEAANEDLNGNCIRADADTSYEVLKTAQEDEVLAIALNVHGQGVEGWHPVRLDAKGEKVGWISKDSGQAIEGGAKFKVKGTSLEPTAIRKILEEVKKLDPSLDIEVKRIDGELWLRDAEAKYAEGNFRDAYASYESARALVPGDPRVSRAFTAWLRANLMMIGIFVGAIVLIAGGFAVLMMRRQKRVHVAEFKYYGKNRSRVEREIDGPSAASAPEPAPDAAPPANPS